MMKKNIIYCFTNLLLFIFIIISNDLLARTEYELNNPHNTIFNHIDNLRKDNYHPDKAVKSFKISRISRSEAQEKAEKLLRIYNGLGLYVNFKNIPIDDNYIDTLSGQNRYILFKQLPEIYLEKYGDKWLYSEESVSMIDKLYKSTFKFDTYYFIENLPQIWHNTFISIYLWQWVGLFALIIISFILYFILKLLLHFSFIKILCKYYKNAILIKYIKIFAKPISLIIVTIIFSQSIIILELPYQFSAILWIIIKIIQPILITYIVFKLIHYIAEILSAHPARPISTINDHLIPLLRKIFQSIVVVLGVLYLLSNLGIDITPLIAGVSVGGIALAFAAQETVKNLIGSLTIFADQPFVVGDLIAYDSSEGVVEKIGIRSTQVRSVYNSLITIPNGKLSDSKIDNLGKREMRRYRTILSISYNTTTEKIDIFVQGLNNIILNQENTNKENYQVSLYDINESAIQIFVNVFFNVQDWTLELKSRHKLISEFLKYADSIGVQFAFPRRSVYIENQINNNDLNNL